MYLRHYLSSSHASNLSGVLNIIHQAILQQNSSWVRNSTMRRGPNRDRSAAAACRVPMCTVTSHFRIIFIKGDYLENNDIFLLIL